ncbi:MAG: YciI family protein [Aeromicrobium sp.]
MTMRFLVLVHLDESAGEAGPPSASMLEAMTAFRADTTHGTFLDDGGLLPPPAAVRVRTSGGTTTVLDGPFAESKEVIGGFFVVESPSTDDVAIWSEGFVALHAEHWPALTFTAEVRQIVDGAP